MTRRRWEVRNYPLRFEDPDAVIHLGFYAKEVRETACEEAANEVTWPNVSLEPTEASVTCLSCLAAEPQGAA